MFKTKLEITQDTHLHITIQNLQDELTRKGVDLQTSADIVDHFQTQLEPIFRRGKDLFELGSQLKAETVVKGEGYKITINAKFGIKESFLKRLIGGA